MEQSRDRLRVAVAGCHRMTHRVPGSHNFATAFHAVPETDVVAVFDLGADTRTEFVDCWQEVWGDLRTYDDYHQMLSEIQPDLLCIATRQTMHADQIELAVDAGVRGILCDKPLATSLAEMDRIVAACRDVPLLLALDRRWMPRYCSLRKLVADGAIGAVTSATAYALSNLINHGCHSYDAILGLAGDIEPVWVSGLVEDVSQEPPDSRRRMDPVGHAQIGLANGAVFYVTPNGRHESSGMTFEVTGEHGRLFLLDDANESYLWSEDGAGLHPLDLPEETEPWTAGKVMVNDLVQAALTGRRTACDIEHARRATEIGFAIHSSSIQSGAKVDLPIADRSFRVESYPWGNE